MNIAMPFDTESAQSTYQTTYDANMATINAAIWCQYNTGTTASPLSRRLISQGDYTLIVPDSTSGASAITVLGAVSLAVLSAVF